MSLVKMHAIPSRRHEDFFFVDKIHRVVEATVLSMLQRIDGCHARMFKITRDLGLCDESLTMLLVICEPYF